MGCWVPESDSATLPPAWRQRVPGLGAARARRALCRRSDGHVHRALDHPERAQPPEGVDRVTRSRHPQGEERDRNDVLTQGLHGVLLVWRTPWVRPGLAEISPHVGQVTASAVPGRCCEVRKRRRGGEITARAAFATYHY